MWFRVLLVLAVLSGLCRDASAQVDISQLKVDASTVGNERQLVKRSSLILFAWIDNDVREYPTKGIVSSGKLVNYTQIVHVKRVLKGEAPSSIRLLTTGVEPLPKPADPLNKIYSGPLAEGDYVLFLQSVSGTDLYSIVGVWQGVYPVVEGKTIALQGTGFPSLGELSVQNMERKIKRLEK